MHIRSIKNREHLFQVRELATSTNMDNLSISESWLNSTVIITQAEVEIPGYRLHRLDRKLKKGAGVRIYVRNDFKSNIIQNLSTISTNGFHQ